jgi:hypothetical protein
MLIIPQITRNKPSHLLLVTSDKFGHLLDCHCAGSVAQSSMHLRGALSKGTCVVIAQLDNTDGRAVADALDGLH